MPKQPKGPLPPPPGKQPKRRLELPTRLSERHYPEALPTLPISILPLTVIEETRYSTVTLPKGRGVQCLQWYQFKRGAIPTVDELTQYRTQFTPTLKSPRGSREWQLY